jgi:hypothetical protein
MCQKVQSHNWPSRLLPDEIGHFTMIISTVWHDGIRNVYNVNMETPLGILYKNQSVMEAHHCTMAIAVMSGDECNLF